VVTGLSAGVSISSADYVARTWLQIAARWGLENEGGCLAHVVSRADKNVACEGNFVVGTQSDVSKTLANKEMLSPLKSAANC
jgi:hypothetical protein